MSLKLPVATRLPSAMSRSALSSLPKGSGRMELVEVKLWAMRSLLRFGEWHGNLCENATKVPEGG